jgi:hypothetical protein
MRTLPAFFVPNDRTVARGDLDNNAASCQHGIALIQPTGDPMIDPVELPPSQPSDDRLLSRAPTRPPASRMDRPRRWLLAAMVALLAFAALAWSAATGEGETGALLQRIKKVGREGAGNDEGAKAWKSLVARGTAALIPILSAMDEDDLTSANWLRPAFEAIAERTLEAGKSLPKSDLEKFLRDTNNPPSARRLAYEWLVKIDKTTPDRFLPGMLLDPSSELRRDAVARLIDQAKKQLDAKDEKAARETFQRALRGACDQDQVDAITQALGKLGVKVDLQAHFGVIASWRLIAPFDHRRGCGWDVAYPPEKGIDLTATYKGKEGKEAKWVAYQTKDPHGMVDLNKVLGKMKGTVAYAFAAIDSPKERPVELRFGTANGVKLFLNGKEIFAREEYHHAAGFDQYSARGTLKAGRNEVLLKVCQNEQEENWAQAWFFQLRVCDFVGAAVPFTPAKEKR